MLAACALRMHHCACTTLSMHCACTCARALRMHCACMGATCASRHSPSWAVIVCVQPCTTTTHTCRHSRSWARAQRRGNLMPTNVRAGVMLEVPGLIFQMAALTKRVDFISVGSNDMLQFLFAADRGNPQVASRYDELAPAVLNFLGEIAQRCGDSETDLSLCGEMAGDPLAAMTLIGLGFRNLSMSAPSIGPVKAMVRSLDVGALQSYLGGLKDSADHSLRDQLKGFAADHGVLV